MADRLVRSAPWTTLCGVVTLLLGLAWDARLHRLRPEPAAHEGIFTLANPAHSLFALGLGLVVGGSIAFLLGLAFRRSTRSVARRATAFGLAGVLTLLAMSTFASAAAAQRGHQAGHAPAARAQDGGMGHEHPSDDAGAATPEQTAAAAKLAADVKASTARFADFAVAEAEGYWQTTPFWNGKSGPAHYNNNAYSVDRRILDLARPEGLVYFRTPDGRMLLLGALYVAPTGQGPTPGGPLTAWHAHDNLCFGPGGASLAVEPGRCRPGARFLGDAIEMMHVWVDCREPRECFAAHLDRAAIERAVRGR